MFRPPPRLSQAVFWAAALVALVGALWPNPPTPEVSNLDKAVHFTTFYVLELLALLAFPRARTLAPVVGLVLFGGAIEIVQGMVGRDASVWDLVADGLGVLAGLLPFAMARWARSLR
jgi:VanZ family protein